MEELNAAATVLGLGGAAIVVGLVEMVKRTAELGDGVWRRVIPALTLVVALGWNALVMRLVPEVAWRWEVLLFLSVFTALSAMGLYSGGRSVMGK